MPFHRSEYVQYYSVGGDYLASLALFFYLASAIYISVYLYVFQSHESLNGLLYALSFLIGQLAKQSLMFVVRVLLLGGRLSMKA